MRACRYCKNINEESVCPVCKNTEFALPNKFFEYMMAGLALARADLIEMRNLTDSLTSAPCSIRPTRTASRTV